MNKKLFSKIKRILIYPELILIKFLKIIDPTQGFSFFDHKLSNQYNNQ